MPIFLTLLSLTAWAIKPIRTISPPVFWVKYHHKINDFKAQLIEHQKWQQNWLQQARANVQITPNFKDNQTIILIISESLTSFNMGVCGYPRNTTPYISSHLNELTVFCNAYSGYPNTLGAVKSILTDVPAMQPDSIPTQSILADAKIAGFKTFWLSNQDDTYLASLFGSFTDYTVYNNKRSGRSSMAKDEELLPHIQTALKDPAPKKLIVVHLIGSHPNYSARYPKAFNLFPSNNRQIENQISEQMEKAQVGSWVKHLRNEYDNSIAYQDWIFSQIFHLLKQDNTEERGLIFLSDHGNEVGHVKNFAGHSPTTEAGYHIPIILWHSTQNFPKGVQTKAVDATQLDNNLLYMMGLRHNTTTNIPWTDSNYLFNIKPYWQQ